jgi:hypothetical protein
VADDGLTPPALDGFIDEANGTTEIGADEFCEYATLNRTPQDVTIEDRFIYSFDARKVMNTWFSAAGAHGDVRSKSTKTGCGPLQKREYVFNFIYTFTHELRDQAGL